MSPPNRLAQLLKILAAEPNDPFTLYGIAQEYAKASDITNAITFYDRCLAADPGYCYAYYHKAKTLADHDRTPEAIAVLNTGIIAAKKAQDAKALGEMQGLLDSLE